MNFRDYIHGKRYGKEANQLEREAMNDAFLQDAIDGYDSVQGDHFSAIEKLEKQLTPPPKRVDKRVWMWAAAAVLVLLIGIPFLLRQPDAKDVQVASSTETAKKTESDVLLPQKDTILMADNIEQEALPTAKPPIQEEKTAKRETVLAPEEDKIIQPEKKLTTPKEPERVTAQAKIDSSVSEQLQGRVAGVAVSSESENKLSRNVRIRGASSIASSNQKLVYGRLVDPSGEPIIGGTINIKNTQFGTVTDTEGKFKLTVPDTEKGTLVASYVGYESSEIPLKENVGNIVMKENTDLLSEVVVLGFGTQKKETKVGSVSKVKDEAATFGEVEFKRYFEENFDKTLCANDPISVTVEFYVNGKGQPGNIVIKENSCPDLEVEIKRLLLGSPVWSETDRKVTLNIEIE